jgi:hypothetical protein
LKGVGLGREKSENCIMLKENELENRMMLKELKLKLLSVF